MGCRLWTKSRLRGSTGITAHTAHGFGRRTVASICVPSTKSFSWLGNHNIVHEKFQLNINTFSSWWSVVNDTASITFRLAVSLNFRDGAVFRYVLFLFQKLLTCLCFGWIFVKDRNSERSGRVGCIDARGLELPQRFGFGTFIEISRFRSIKEEDGVENITMEEEEEEETEQVRKMNFEYDHEEATKRNETN